MPRERWPATHVADVMIPLANLQTAKLDDDLAQVFERLVAEDVNQLPVVDDGRFVGMVARDTILNLLRTRTAANSSQPSA